MYLLELRLMDKINTFNKLANYFADTYDDKSTQNDKFYRDIKGLSDIWEEIKKGSPEDLLSCIYQRLPIPTVETSESAIDDNLYFLSYRVNRNIKDIISRDIPIIREEFHNYFSVNQFNDDLKTTISSQLEQWQYGDAIRRGFIYLSATLRKKYGMPDKMDGDTLVNSIFGSKGIVANKIPDDEREAIRNLLAGLYGVFRNTFSHHLLDCTWNDSESTLLMINWILEHLP
ncbi:hypothetical protein KAU45_06395 [bacterium]|nr:hypothetical protein [bacterium]